MEPAGKTEDSWSLRRRPGTCASAPFRRGTLSSCRRRCTARNFNRSRQPAAHRLSVVPQERPVATRRKAANADAAVPWRRARVVRCDLALGNNQVETNRMPMALLVVLFFYAGLSIAAFVLINFAFYVWLCAHGAKPSFFMSSFPMYLDSVYDRHIESNAEAPRLLVSARRISQINLIPALLAFLFLFGFTLISAAGRAQ
jgi:hypothetical protein